MQNLQQLFVHELQDAFAAEQALVSALERMSQCQTNQQIQQNFRTHLSETQVHLDRLQQIFSTLGLQPGNIRCEGMDGILQEHNQFVQQQQMPDSQMHSMFDIGAGERVEHYEIATYEGLVRLANALGMNQAAQLLEANLADERQQLSRLQNLGSTMARQQRGQPQGGLTTSERGGTTREQRGQQQGNLATGEQRGQQPAGQLGTIQ